MPYEHNELSKEARILLEFVGFHFTSLYLSLLISGLKPLSKLPIVAVLALFAFYGRPPGFLLLAPLLQKVFTHQSQDDSQGCYYEEEHQCEDNVAYNVANNARR